MKSIGWGKYIGKYKGIFFLFYEKIIFVFFGDILREILFSGVYLLEECFRCYFEESEMSLNRI